MAAENQVEKVDSSSYPEAIRIIPQINERLVWKDKECHGQILFYYVQKIGDEVRVNEDPYSVEEKPTYRIPVVINS